jgi:hypothetical protein
MLSDFLKELASEWRQAPQLFVVVLFSLLFYNIVLSLSEDRIEIDLRAYDVEIKRWVTAEAERYVERTNTLNEREREQMHDRIMREVSERMENAHEDMWREGTLVWTNGHNETKNWVRDQLKATLKECPSLKR